jgi:hypothetical protein
MQGEYVGRRWQEEVRMRKAEHRWAELNKRALSRMCRGREDRTCIGRVYGRVARCFDNVLERTSTRAT